MLVEVVHEVVAAAGGLEVDLVFDAVGVDGVDEVIERAVPADKDYLVLLRERIKELLIVEIYHVDVLHAIEKVGLYAIVRPGVV